MRGVLVVLAILIGCGDDGQMTPNDAALDSGGTVEPGSCTSFVLLESKWWSRELPYIEPTSGVRIYIAGDDFSSLWGQSDPQPDDTTLVWTARIFHFEDGTTQLGTAGTRGTSTMCEWVTPARVEE